MVTKKNIEERKKSADEINLGVKDKRGNHSVSCVLWKSITIAHNEHIKQKK